VFTSKPCNSKRHNGNEVHDEACGREPERHAAIFDEVTDYQTSERRAKKQPTGPREQLVDSRVSLSLYCLRLESSDPQKLRLCDGVRALQESPAPVPDRRAVLLGPRRKNTRPVLDGKPVTSGRALAVLSDDRGHDNDQ
jgi:hypothetical protein